MAAIGTRLLLRIPLSLALLVAVSMAGFGLLKLPPGDSAEILLIQQMDGALPSPAVAEAFKQSHGFLDPLPVQYLRWLGGLLRGELGTSSSDRAIEA